MPENTSESFPTQKVVFSDKAHSKMLKGASTLASAVVSTMGPSGHNVIIDFGEGGSPLITKDGVTVAKSINLSDKLESIGAELMKEVASKTNDIAGDGTTTSIALAYTMLEKGVQMISTGRSSIYLKKGMDAATETVLEFLGEQCVNVDSRQDIVNVGSISANGDKELGELIADAIDKVGRNGVITIEPAKSVQTTLEVVDGMRIETGFVSPFFITNNDKANCEFVNPLILITTNKISTINDIVPAMEIAVNEGKPLLVIADEVEGEALHTLIVNKAKGALLSCAIKAPFFGEHRAEVLSDLATVVGAEIIGATSETTLSKIKLEQLGTCSKTIVNRMNSTFVGDTENTERVEKTKERINELVNLVSDATLDANQVERYKSRLARISGGIAVIRVGGSTEVEIREKKDRIEDAVNATTAAAQEGIVAGGGLTLFAAAQKLKSYIKSNVIQERLIVEGIPEGNIDDFMDGVRIVVAACEAPLRIIVKNTGLSDDVVIANLSREEINDESERPIGVMNNKNRWASLIKWNEETNEIEVSKSRETVVRCGYNARSGKYEDLFDAGVIDPVKVTRHALIHASSVVGLMLTCNAVIVDEDER